MPDRSVTEFPTSGPDLWDACTNPRRLGRWFEPVEGEFTVGGRYRLVDSGTVGTIERCDAQSVLTISWEYDGDQSLVEAAFGESENGRRFATAWITAWRDAHVAAGADASEYDGRPT